MNALIFSIIPCNNVLVGLTGLPLYLETWKNLEFDNLGKKYMEKPGVFNNFYMLKSKISI